MPQSGGLIYDRKQYESVDSMTALFRYLFFHNLFGAWRRTSEHDSKTLASAAILQRDATCNTNDRSLSLHSNTVRFEHPVAEEKPDLVVWPEGAMGGPLNPDDER